MSPGRGMMSDVDLLALLLSVIAIVIAAFAAAFTRRQALATEHLRDADHERRRDERAPNLTLERTGQSGGVVTVVLTNDGPVGLSNIRARFPGRQHCSGPAAAIDNGSGPATSADLGALAMGDQRTFSVTLTDPDVGGQVTLAFDASDGRDEWETIARFDVPHPPMVF